MDLRRLREETRPEHEATEALMPVMAPGLTVPEYTRVLRLLLPIIRGWEQWAAGAAPERLRPLLAARRRQHLLESDLRTMGEASAGAEGDAVDWAAVVADGPEAQGTGFEAAFLGAVYVMEGSTLGGRFLARQVEAALGLAPGRGNAYFQGHGDETGRLWREITAEIAAVPEGESERVIRAAKRTFAAFGDALRAGVTPEPPPD